MSDEDMEEPWRFLSDQYRDLTLMVQGEKLCYHKAVLAQHSRLVRHILTDNSWCQCNEVIINLDDVEVESVKYVMDLIYAGVGGFANPTGKDKQFKDVLKMLLIDTIVMSNVEVEESFNLEEFCDVLR